MNIGADTWFLLLIAEGNNGAKSLLEQVVAGTHELFISCLSIAEICSVLIQKGIPGLADKLIKEIILLPSVHIINFDLNLARESSRRKQAFGLSMMDAGIITTAILNKCPVFIATDSDYKNVTPNIIRIVKPDTITL
ncbi:MAG TPA: PIN domain-containing protein [Candidatus Nanoarchaeia archaeon]|nr:PIN domain-containing protein [Candidatus Nanoarchaeia archaeon]